MEDNAQMQNVMQAKDLDCDGMCSLTAAKNEMEDNNLASDLRETPTNNASVSSWIKNVPLLGAFF